MTHRQILRAFSGLLLALLVAILSSTIVSNALPTILADLNGTQNEYTWVVTAMLLTSTATTPIWGKLSDLFSKKLLYQLAIVIFTVGSVLGGIAQSMPELIGFRALQGIGMGGLQALIQVVIAAMISPRERGRYSGYIGATFAVATVSGPLVGGLIVDSPLGWRWCFWVCVPIAVLAFIVLGRTLKLPVVKRQVKIDWLGATLLVGGVALLLIWVSLAGKNFAWWSWASGLFVGGALLVLALAVFVESRVAEPVVPLRLFRNRTFTLATLGTLAVGTAMFGGAVFLGQYFQIARGYSPTHAGLMTLPMVLGLFLSSTIAGQVISRTGRTKPFLVGGAVLLLIGLGLLSTVDHTTNLTLMGGYLALMGIGVGSLMQNLVLVVQNTIGMRDMGSASSTVTFFRTLGGAAGVSALGAVLAGEVSRHITESLAARGIPTGGAVRAGGATMNVNALPEPMREIVRAAYGDATGRIFLIAGCVAVVTLITVLFIREVPLRSTIELSEPSDKAPAPAAPEPEPAGAGIASGDRKFVRVHGTVTGSAGAPVGGATVTLTDADGTQIDRARTDAHGRYDLRAPGGASYVLIAAAGRFQPTAALVVPGVAGVRHDVSLSGAARLSGRVRNREGRPVGGATLVLTDEAGQVVASELSGGDGWYQVGELAAGSYALTVTAAEHRPSSARLSLLDGESVERDVELAAVTRLAGTVRSARHGRTVPDAQVTVVDERGEVVATGLTDERGRYDFAGLAPGEYTLVASGYAPTSAPLAIDRPGRHTKDVELGYPAEYRGPVR